MSSFDCSWPLDDAQLDDAQLDNLDQDNSSYANASRDSKHDVPNSIPLPPQDFYTIEKELFTSI
jgi:hypothetical protein